MTFELGTDQRAAIVGRTGSGKTTLAKALVANLSSLVVIDPKWRFELPYDPRRAAPQLVTGPRSFGQTWPQRALRVIYRPVLEAKGEDVDEVIRRVLNVGHSCLLIDEAMEYATPTTILPAYRAAQVRGREAHVRVISCTQRPTGVHNVVLSEAEHYFLFDLHLRTDRDKMAGLMGEEATVELTEPYAFLYAGPGTNGRVVHCSPLRVADPRPAVPAPRAAVPPGG